MILYFIGGLAVIFLVRKYTIHRRVQMKDATVQTIVEVVSLLDHMQCDSDESSSILEISEGDSPTFARYFSQPKLKST